MSTNRDCTFDRLTQVFRWNTKRAGKALAVLTLAALASAAQATTYYVSTSGNDTNAGTTTGAAWRTAAKVNSTHFNAGDVILFQRGGEWHESLNPTGGDGATGNPITFADYGSGAKPKFWGSDPIANSGWTNTSGTIYTHPYTTQVGAVYVNHVALVPANPNANQPVESIPNSFSWDGNTLKISVPTNPNTDGKLYTIASRQDVICNGNAQNFSLHNHLVFTNVVADESGDLNGGYGVRIQNGTDIALNGVESYRCGKHNFGCINSTQVIHNNCYAAYPMPNQDAYGGYSAYVSYGDSSTGLNNQTSEYHNCVGDYMDDTYHNSPYVDTGYEFFTTHGANVGSVLLDHCSALSSAAGGPGAHWTISNSESAQAGHAATITILGGYLQNNQLVMQGTGLVVDGLQMVGPGATSSNDATATIDMECSNSTVQNLLMNGINIGYWLYQAAIQNNGSNNTIRFCTLVNDPSSGDASLRNTGASLTFNGNLIVNSGNWLAGNAPATSLNNLIYSAASSAGFTNASTGDYTLSSSSPAIDSVPLSVQYPATDRVGTARPHGSANDAGAYQYTGTGGTPSAPVISSSGTASGTVGTAFSYQITASNSPTSFSATGLPTGLSVNTSTGLISGTPTTAATSTVTLGATNAGGTGNKTLTITVSAGATESPYGGTRWSIPGKIEAENYDLGGQGLAYNDSDTGNTGGAYRSDNVDVRTVVSDTGGGYQVGWTVTGEWLKYMVNVTTAGTYDFQVREANGGSASGTIHIEVDGTNVTGAMTLPTTGGWDTFNTVTKTGVTMTAGQHTIRIYEDAGGPDLNWINIVSSTPAETPYGGTAWAIPGQIEAENYDVGGEGIAYHDVDAGNTGGAYRSDNVDILASSDTGGGYQVGWTNSGEYLKYTVNVTATGTYQFHARVASGGGGGSIHFSVDGTNVTGTMSFADTGGYGNFITINSGNVSLTAGTHIIQLSEDTNAFDVNWFSVTSVGTPFNVNALFTSGTAVTNGGADSYGNAYNSGLVGTSASFNSSSFTFGPANALDAWTNTTVALPAGSYTTLNMLATGVGGVQNSQTFVVHYTDSTTQTFTKSLSDWRNPQSFAGETQVITMPSYLGSAGQSITSTTYIYGYTFALNGKSVQSITLPATRGVIAFGFAGR